MVLAGSPLNKPRIAPMTPSTLPTSRLIPLNRYNVPDDMVKNLLAGILLRTVAVAAVGHGAETLSLA
jgi:hypothetical protein